METKGNPEKDRTALYQVVSQRRLQWDNLLWQIPTMTLTGEAFLFTIALSPDISKLSRSIASLLAMILSYSAILSMGRHRFSEITDSEWIQHAEKEIFGTALHGEEWSLLRRRAMNEKVLNFEFSKISGGQISWNCDYRECKYVASNKSKKELKLELLAHLKNEHRKTLPERVRKMDIFIVFLNRGRAIDLWIWVFLIFFITAFLVGLAGLISPELFTEF